MRWVTFRKPGDGRDRIGVIDGDVIHALEPGVALIDLLGDDGERLAEAAGRALAHPAETVAADAVDLRPPIPRPPSIRDFMAFEQHVQAAAKSLQLDINPDWYQMPVFYFTNPVAAVGARDPVAIPPGSQRLDFELEVAAVVGREGADLSPQQALDHIVGYCILNDWSARDLQAREMPLHLGPAKGKDFATTLGPALVTADELEPYRAGAGFDLEMRVSVNGRPYGSDRWSNVYWSFPEMVAYASRGTRVVPGDVIGSGTCGAGCLLELAFEHGAEAYPWLRPGDEVVCEIDRLGRIANRVIAGSQPIPLRVQR
jgi:2-keto-4-pentenoate hydratase/2-oxohepta-3-ene-1,7-dioic acid hydratase in catechol pathway